jgi:hypothetical protein
MSKARSFRVRVLGCDFELRPGSPEELRGKWGRCDLQERSIIYADYLSKSAIRETVFHELLHTADVSVSINETELTEAQVTRVSAVLFGMLRDHSQLVDWLFGDEDE